MVLAMGPHTAIFMLFLRTAQAYVTLPKPPYPKIIYCTILLVASICQLNDKRIKILFLKFELLEHF